MKPGPFSILIITTLLANGSASCGARERHWPKPTPPPDPSPIYHDVEEAVPTEEDIARAAREKPARLEHEIESATRGPDAQRREAAFVFLLPELLQVAPERVVNLVARQQPGPARDQLRTEVSRLWASRDTRAAAAWIKTLEADERRAAGIVAVREVAPVDLRRALELAADLGLGKLAGSGIAGIDALPSGP